MTHTFAKIKITGNTPLLLDNAARGWQVEAGVVEIFWEEINSGSPGKRLHAFRVEENELCLGMQGNNSSQYKLPVLRLIAVAVGEALVREIDLAEYWKRSPELATKKVETWVGRMIHEIAGNEPSPRDYRLSNGRNHHELTPGQSLRSEQALEWVSQTDGPIHFYNASVREFQSPLPISHDGWITADEQTAINLSSTRSVFDACPPQEIVQPFHELAAENFIHAETERETREQQQYRLSRGKETAGIAGAMQKLKAILAPEWGKESVSGLPPLLAASILIGQSAGIPISHDTEIDDETTMEDIARKNGFRIREVVLDGKWWKNDNGPLLGILDNGEIPVALISKGSTGYIMVNPLTEKKQVIDKKRAASLLSIAYMLYRPFPARKLDWKDMMRFGFHGCRRDWRMLLLLGTLSGLLGLLTPIATGVIIGTCIPQASKTDILQITLILISAAFAIAVFNVIKGIAMVRMEGRMDLSIQAAVWDRLLSLPVPFFKDYSAGDLAVRSLGIMAIREILSGATLTSVLTLAFTSFNLVWLFYYDWQLALVAIILTCIGAAITIGAGLCTLGYQRQLFDIQGRLSGMVLQFITGINKLRTTGTENRAFRVWANEYVAQKKCNFLSGKIDTKLAAFNSAFPVIVSMILFAWFYYLRFGKINVADFIAFNVAYTAFQTALLQIAMVLPTSAHVIPLFNRAKPILETLPEFNDVSEKPGRLTGDIQVSHADFRYAPEGLLILRDVSLRAKPGEFVAVVGGSGAGKSTLLRLLLGFESPQTGGIFYDNKDLKNLDVREVRRQIGVVLQNGKLMAGDIYRNIVGTSNLTMDDAWEAARMVGIADDIEAMPMKLNTLVPAGGGSLSGGQRQRLLIARAIANRPRILLFDEATSALDNKTQAIVSRSLEKLKVTRIVIAHRLSTIMNADTIYAMQKGHVVESGTYEELMARKGYFYDLAKRQIS